MGFWIFMLLMDLLVPAVMIGFGRLFMYRSPETINNTFGYRTAMSMKNRDTWDFAHRRCGRFWFRWGLGILIPSCVPLLFVLGADTDAVGYVGLAVCLAQMIPLLAVLPVTEKALKAAFYPDGTRRI